MRVLIAETFGLCRVGLKSILHQEMGKTEVAEATTMEEVLSLAPTADILIGCSSVINHLDDIKIIAEACPELRIFILSNSQDRAFVLSALEAGAHGVLDSTSKTADIAKAITWVAAGNIFVPTDMTRSVAQTEGEYRPLTPRQQQVLRLLTAGQSNKEIARSLDIMEGTVKVHVTSLFRTLGVHNRIGAVNASQRFLNQHRLEFAA